MAYPTQLERTPRLSRPARPTWFRSTRRNQRPIPLAPRHRRVWRGLRRYCSCGLRWRTCPDRHAPVPTEPTAAPPPNRPSWAQAAVAQAAVANPQFGRAGRRTLTQSWRADGGQW
ncbi:hypothetical protein [Verrucosispora sp. TAA-831]|uniref:hypothetical protein n=1 Tax=Verrucosispora sp. TAA-831 TaxID=3422227 RepID=UPI003D6F16B0